MNYFFFIIVMISDILEEKNKIYWNNKMCVIVFIDISKYMLIMYI